MSWRCSEQRLTNSEKTNKMENHKLRSVYFFGTPKQVAQINEHGYSIIRHVKGNVYEARVTNQDQFLEIAETFSVDSTIAEEEVDTTIAGVDFSEALRKLERL